DSSAAIDYPQTETVDHVDVYHGTEVADPYRWLEQDIRESDQVENWVERQNALAFQYLESLPGRDAVLRRTRQLYDYERYGIAPPRHEEHFFERHGGRYYAFRNDGLRNQSVLEVRDTVDGEPRVLIDPNTWSEDGTVALAQVSFSPDGRWMGYGIQESGSDWRTWRFVDLETAEHVDDELSWIKFTDLAWRPDGSGFYYGRYPRPAEGEAFTSLNTDHRLMFHAMGTDESDDRVVHERPDQPEWSFSADVTGDGRWLVIATSKGTDDRNRLELLELADPSASLVTVVDGFEAEYDYVTQHDGMLLFKSTEDAPRGRVLAYEPASDEWREVIGQRDAVLRDIERVGQHVVAEWQRDARSEISVHALDGAHVRDVALPGIGTATGFEGKADSPETFYLFSSFNQPPTVYRYDVASGGSEVIASAEVDFDPEAYVVKQVFYTSKDGTRVPMFIVHREGIALDGSHPTLLYGYGGFNSSQLPKFDPSRIAWLEMGGIYAVANLRGGGEYGEEWHKAGTRLQKQNVFDDFIAAGEYLVAENYTSPEHLAVYGRSNGGLLVGAVINQRPDLFAAALPQVGVMDMLRFQNFTAGRYWTDDYGSSDNPEEFEALYAYSPYHNIREGVEYPAVLVTTGDTDDRVVPGHSFKYIARLQQALPDGSPPALIRVDRNTGHADGKPTELIIREYADQWAFIAHHTGLELPEGFAPPRNPEP
ncbi:MAG: prolyl oligopeptidase family serine peptidase, partial [Xanthomonadales bacterium]|nr:prolyl oligopeptidase family serine peptidase [Xanthomonadales bacterium]